MSKVRLEIMLAILIAITLLLLLADLGLFIRMNRLESYVRRSLQFPGGFMGLEVGKSAPDFSLTDVEGHELSLKDFGGQPVLLVFSAINCLACQRVYGVLKDFQTKHSDVKVLMISRGSQEDNRTLVEEEQLPFPVLIWEDEVAKAYEISGVPFFYLINEQGRIEAKGIVGSLEALEKMLR